MLVQTTSSNDPFKGHKIMSDFTVVNKILLYYYIFYLSMFQQQSSTNRWLTLKVKAILIARKKTVWYQMLKQVGVHQIHKYIAKYRQKTKKLKIGRIRRLTKFLKTRIARRKQEPVHATYFLRTMAELPSSPHNFGDDRGKH